MKFVVAALIALQASAQFVDRESSKKPLTSATYFGSGKDTDCEAAAKSYLGSYPRGSDKKKAQAAWKKAKDEERKKKGEKRRELSK